MNAAPPLRPHLRAALLAAGALLATSTVHASPIPVASYSMLNGGTGSFNYRDFTYVPCNGACDVTNAPLSGGTGKLTDGVSPATSWNQQGANTAWVGWYTQYQQLNPTVTFFFAGPSTIDSVTVWVDNTIGSGGVYLPSSVSIGGVNHAIAPDNANPAPRGYTFTGLGLSGSSVDVQFFHSTAPWIMVGEVSFDGVSGDGSVPLPGTLALVGAALLGAAAARRRAA